MKLNEGKHTGSLKWGHWVEGLEDLVIEHKGNYYLRISPKTPETPESGADIIATRYYNNGCLISKSEVVQRIGEEKTAACPVYTIKFENIKAIS